MPGPASLLVVLLKLPGWKMRRWHKTDQSSQSHCHHLVDHAYSRTLEAEVIGYQKCGPCPWTPFFSSMDPCASCSHSVPDPSESFHSRPPGGCGSDWQGGGTNVGCHELVVSQVKLCCCRRGDEESPEAITLLDVVTDACPCLVSSNCGKSRCMPQSKQSVQLCITLLA